jgi:peptidyl-prolyl cis-trans isomerase D
MLQAIRDKVTGWIAYGIIFLISIPFALWGVNSYLGGGEVAPAATVNGEEITARELDQAYARYRQRLARLFGGTIPQAFGSEEALRQQVREQLIEEYALRQYIDERRYRIADADLNQMIRSRQEFQRDGQFDSSLYQAQVSSLGMSPVGFEENLRTSAAVQQFQQGLQATAFTLPSTKQQFDSLRNQTRKLRTLTYKVDVGQIEIGEQEIEDYYQSQAERYMTPEQVKIDYIELSLDSVKQGIEVPEADVFSRYQANRAAYTAPEVRTASHILIKSGDDDQDQQGLEKITEIRNRIVAGESFADLAREYSEDPGSASDGGNLGEIETGVMVPSFETALFSMQVDELSEPVKTRFGWHLIKLHEIRGGETRSFESMRSELEDEIRSELAENQIYDLVEGVANLAYEQPDSLAPAAEQLGLQLRTSDWFSRVSGDGIAAESQVRQQAFANEVLQQGLNSEGIELGSERIVFLRVNEHRDSQQQSLDEVRETVIQDLRRLRTNELANAAGSAGLDELEAGKSLQILAEEWSAQVEELGFVGRNQAEIDAAIRNRAFGMGKPDQGPLFDGLALGNGEYVIVELSAVQASEGAGDEQALSGLTAAVAEADYRAAVDLLSSRAEVTRTPIDELQ